VWGKLGTKCQKINYDGPARRLSHSWRIALCVALVQIFIAAMAVAYSPYQYKARRAKDHGMGFCYRAQNDPPEVLQASYIINFPALCARHFIECQTDLQESHRIHGELYYTRDFVYITCVGVYWCMFSMWIMLCLRQYVVGDRRRSTAISSMVMIGYAYYAWELSIYWSQDYFYPMRHVGAWSVVWYIVLASAGALGIVVSVLRKNASPVG